MYGPELLHTTVRSIEGFRGSVPPDDEAVERYARVLEEEVRDQRALAIRYAGVAPTLSGVLAQGFAVDNSLAKLRVRLHLRLADDAPVPGPETQSPRDLDHASVVLFLGPFSDPLATIAAIETHSATEFGVVQFDHIDPRSA